ncbi:MAG: YdjY domain-containing protein [Planctomycetota bacterium]|nr:YdjY domain-containing protein [Planctomycetota bacterium]
MTEQTGFRRLNLCHVNCKAASPTLVVAALFECFEVTMRKPVAGQYMRGWDAAASIAVAVGLLIVLSCPTQAEPGGIEIDAKAGTVRIPAKVLKQNVYEQLKGAIEYIACAPGGKQYEALFVCPVDPQELYQGLKQIGLNPGKPAKEDGASYQLPQGGKLRITIEWKPDGALKSVPVEDFVLDVKTGKAMPAMDWAFTGSRMAVNPETGKTILQASVVMNLIALHHLDATVLIQNPLEDGRDDNRYKVNLKALPEEGTEVVMVFSRVGDSADIATEGLVRIHWFIQGRVQGVGFRAYTELNAKRSGIRGWVRNLENGQVELMAEGPAEAMATFQAKVRKGPRGSAVEKVEEGQPDRKEILGEFEIRQ